MKTKPSPGPATPVRRHEWMCRQAVALWRRRLGRTVRAVMLLVVFLPPADVIAGSEDGVIAVNTSLDVVDFGGARTIAELPGPDGLVSLAEAVMAANNTAGPNTIVFNIPTTDPNYDLPLMPGGFTLFVEDSAPLIVRDNRTTIDGTTQTILKGGVAVPAGIHLRTTPPYASVPGLLIYSHSNTVRGLKGFSLFRSGLEIQGNGNVIVGNIMTQPGGAAVRVMGRNNRIGGANPGEGNRFSSGGSGVWLSGVGATANFVQGNVIFRNWSDGITIDGGASGNTIGGLGPAGNVIFANGHMNSQFFPSGANIDVSGNYNLIVGNQIGLDELRQPNAGSAWSGITLRGSSNVILSNVIAGHTGYYPALAARPAGVRLGGGTKNVIRGNWIGAGAGGNVSSGNGYGIKVEVWDFADVPAGHTIGGANPGEGNVIAFCQHDGIAIGGSARRIRITGNSIYLNGELGINLGVDPYTETYPNTMTPNDNGDADSGANDLQNFPEITSAESSYAATRVHGTIDAPNPQSVRIELFVNHSVDATGFGEGQTFAGAATPGADGRWSAVLAGDLHGKFVAATATDAEGNTSEFSRAVAVDGPVSRPLIVATDSKYASDSFTFSLAVSPGSVVVIEASTNLVNWFPLATNSVDTIPFRFVHPTPSAHRCFYRVRAP